MNLLGTGLSGLVGVRLIELLSPRYTFTNLSLEEGIDITDIKSVEQIFAANDAPWVLHLAAITDVDAAEKDRSRGKDGLVWKVNVDATANIVRMCRKYHKRLLYVSTDYVFDGRKSVYDESDKPNPQGWYGVTKYEGELLVNEMGSDGLVIRIANPYRHAWRGKPDFVHKIMARLAERQPVVSPDDQIFVPTHIDDIANTISYLVTAKVSGIYHVVGSEALSPYKAAKLIASAFGMDVSLVSATTFAEFFAGRAPRPFHAYLNNAKITNCGISLKTFNAGLEFIRRKEGGKTV